MNNGLQLLTDICPTSVSKHSSPYHSWCIVAVTEFMDLTWSYITDYLQNAESLTIFKDFVIQGQGWLVVRGQRARIWTCKLVLVDPRGQGLLSRTTTLLICMHCQKTFTRMLVKCGELAINLYDLQQNSFHLITVAAMGRDFRGSEWLPSQPWHTASSEFVYVRREGLP